jgi:glycosyl transferase family 87
LFSGVNTTGDRRAWLGLALAVVSAALLLDILVRHDPIGVDFHTYVAAGETVVERGWSNVYNTGIVGIEQKELAPNMVAQPFLSPPTVALIVIPFSFLPYDVAYVLWALLLFSCLAGALVWSGVSKGLGKWIAVVGALGPWWVMHAVNVGQVVPLVAAGTVIAWRLLRDRRDVLAGVALAAILLKPNTAILVPVALLFATRFRTVATWAAVAALVVVLSAVMIGSQGISEYVTQLRGPLPAGADDLTLHGALSVTGTFAAMLRIVIIAGVMAAAVKLRESPGLVVPIAIVGSLVVSPYLHASDLCMLAAAGWMVWEERSALALRIPLVAVWIVASPFLFQPGHSLHLKQWPWVELALLAILLVSAWWPLTGWADSRRRAPA